MPQSETRLSIGWVIALISAIPLIYQTLRNSPAVLTPTLKSTFSLSATQMGVIASAVSLGAIFSALLASRWVEKFGTKPVILLMSGSVIIGALGFGAAQDAWMLFASRFLIGFGAGAYVGAAMIWVGNGRSDEKFRVYWGEVSTISRLGAVLATAPLALLISLLTWRHTIFALAAAAVVMGIILFFSLDNVKQQKGALGDAPWREVFSRFVVIRFWAVMVLLGSMTTVGGLWGGPWLISAYQLKETHVSLFLLLMTIGFALGSSGCVLIGRYLHHWTTPLLMCISSGIFFLLAWGDMPVASITGILFILGFCLAPTTLILAEIRADSDESNLSKRVFSSTIAFSLGVFVYQALSGIVIDSFALTKSGEHPVEAYQALFLIAAVLLVITSIFLLILPPRHKGEGVKV
ncbi:hypothetical protein Maes01_01500 [Microbulbifer aestuariivivens]|uniref:Major facilitator superfamily (MFS) profile domain-containing protein n=1 Tax=Microbulbifer aestuariivivens TaxID=1908308 RepID=A0ABP9WP09_9GAMM